MRIASKFIAGSALALALAFCAPAGAQSAASQRNAAAAEARKQINEAQAQVNEIKAEQKRIKDKLTAEFESKEEWKNTAANHKKAKAAYEKAQKDAKKALASKPEYKKLLQEREAARLKYDELVKQRGGNPDAIAKAGSDATAKGFAIKKMENDIVANDEKVLTAKDAFEVADKEMKALDEEVEGALTSDPDYVAIQQQLDQAEAQVKQMRDARAQQVKSEQQSKAAAGRAASQSKRSSRTETME